MHHTNYKILIVDDNPSNIQLLGSILSSSGYEAEFATSGKDALEWVNTESFDIILLDIMMPEMDGYEVCNILKSNPKTKHIPVIFITAKQDTESIVKGFDVGAVDYISKPFKERELLVRLKHHLELLTAKKELEKLNSDLQEKNDTLMQSIRYAEKLQKAMLTDKNILTDSFHDYFVFFKPLQHLSGDFYWSKPIDDKIIFVLGDSMGHGVPGALLSMLGISALNDITEHSPNISPAQILTQLRAKEKKTASPYSGLMRDSIDMGICLFDKKEKSITFAGANLPIAIKTSTPFAKIDTENQKSKIFTENGLSLIQINGTKNTIGHNLQEIPFKDIKILLNPNDIVYLYTDGFQDQFGGKSGKKFMKTNFLKMLLKNSSSTLTQQAKIIENEFKTWKGSGSQIDDITVIGLQLY